MIRQASDENEYSPPEMTKMETTFVDSGVEKAYEASIKTDRVRALRFFAGFGGMLFIAVIAADYLFMGSSQDFKTLALYRSVAGSTSLLAAALLPRIKSDLAIDSLILAAALSISAVLCLVPYFRIEEAQVHQLIVIIVLILYYGFLPIRLTFLALIGALTTLLLIGIMYFAIHAEPADILGIAIISTMVNGVGLYTARKTTRLSKLNFWRMNQLREEVQQRKQMALELEAAHHEAQISHQQLTDAIDNISEGFVLINSDKKILVCNQNFRDFYGYSDEIGAGTALSTLKKLHADKNILSDESDSNEQEKFYNRFENLEFSDADVVVKLSGGQWLHIWDRVTSTGNLVSLQADITKLQSALDEIRSLKGIMPICSKCKKIRDDKGYWNLLESYIERHSEASFSHSLCPDCSESMYGNETWFNKMKKYQ